MGLRMINIRNHIKNTALIVSTFSLISLNWYSGMNNLADAYVDNGMERSMVVFAIAKILNATVSVLQTTNFSIQPLGVGFGISFGEILDPLNDIIEIFSDFMLFSSLAFGIQKILIMLSGHSAIKIAISLVLLVILLCSLSEKSLPKWILKLSIIFLLIRFGLPVTAIGSNTLFNSFLHNQYESSKTSIESIGAEFDNMTPSEIVPVDSKNQSNKTIELPFPNLKKSQISRSIMDIWGKFGKAIGNDQSSKIPEDLTENTESEPVVSNKWQIPIPTITSIPNLEDLKQHAKLFRNRIIELGDLASKNIIDLIVVFLMQSIIFPFGIFFILYKTSKEILLS
ncbi:MAG: hypothetical protein RLZZ46_1799 [Bacteroidota bacterium]